MSSLVEFAHTVVAEPGEVFDHWLEEHRGQLDADAARLARVAFELGRAYQLSADAHGLAEKWVRDPDLRRQRGEAARPRFTDVAALHRESSRVPERFQEG